MHAKFLSILLSIVTFICSVFGISIGGSTPVTEDEPTGSIIHYSEDKQSVYIELNENSSTGYRWYVDILDDDSVVLTSSKAYYPHNKGLAGAPGVRVFKFDAIKPGKSRIKFEYKRDWESGIQDEMMFGIEVSEDLTVSTYIIPAN